MPLHAARLRRLPRRAPPPCPRGALDRRRPGPPAAPADSPPDTDPRSPLERAVDTAPQKERLPRSRAPDRHRDRANRPVRQARRPPRPCPRPLYPPLPLSRRPRHRSRDHRPRPRHLLEPRRARPPPPARPRRHPRKALLRRPRRLRASHVPRPHNRDLRLEAGSSPRSLYDWDTAARTYEEGITLRPPYSKDLADFDLYLGRAIALRGRLDAAPPAEREERYRAAREAIATAIAFAPKRPEAHFHFGLLLFTHSFGRSTAADSTAFFAGRTALLAFVAEAKDTPSLAAELAEARAHLQRFDDATHCDFRSSASRREAELEERRREAEAEALAPPL
ncbi:MAG: hypothetical protein R3B70_09990 [Polyangiaceae bacterium]